MAGEFDYINHPLIETKNIRRLQGIWEAYWEEMWTGTNWGWDSLEQEMSPNSGEYAREDIAND